MCGSRPNYCGRLLYFVLDEIEETPPIDISSNYLGCDAAHNATLVRCINSSLLQGYSTMIGFLTRFWRTPKAVRFAERIRRRSAECVLRNSSIQPHAKPKELEFDV